MSYPWTEDCILQPEGEDELPEKPQRPLQDATSEARHYPPRLFICGPYRTGDTEKNVEKAAAVTRKLSLQNYACYTPHLQTYRAAGPQRLGVPLHHYDEAWLPLIRAWLPLCDAVATFGHTHRSEGCRQELAQAADLGKPIFRWREIPHAKHFSSLLEERDG